MSIKRRENLTVTLKDMAIQAVRSGNTDRAVELIEQLNNASRSVHDRYCEYVSILLTYIAEAFGEERVKDAAEYMVNNVHRRVLLGPLKNAAHEKAVAATAQTHRNHWSEFFVEEDEEKTVITLTCCGSGGRMMKEGKYENTERHPLMGGITKKAYPWSFNRKGLPYYCVHCAIYNLLWPEWNLGFRRVVEYGRQFDDKGNPVDEPCRVIIYKN
jgi:hypothetical protein